ncbi:MAG: helix-turn-helix transcriptional regulator [Ruminococcaceae bacterium]|nr:helix-turn-helix transcriptional regulator [Oscillospiraceae bacterium]
MKLAIGENIRNFRKKNDLTQEALADRLGVTYQSISRWENGTTYPDLELIPAIAEELSVTVDELLGMPRIEKEKRAVQTFDELRRECIKRDYDADKIVNFLRDIRRNYLDSDSAWRPWCEGNDRAFRDPKILPEVRLLADAYLERHPMYPHTIQTMAYIEDEDHLEDFLKKYTTSFDCSERALLFRRYQHRGDAEKFEPERRYQLYVAFEALLCPGYLLKWGESNENKQAADQFMEAILSLIRCDAEDDSPDMWITDRVELGLKSAVRSILSGNQDEALSKAEAVVKLLEDTMMITDEVVLPTSCRFLDGMEWRAKEYWMNRDNNPDSPEERMIYMATQMNGMCSCYCLFPSNYYDILNGKDFDALRDHPRFIKLCERVKALIVTKQKES